MKTKKNTAKCIRAIPVFCFSFILFSCGETFTHGGTITNRENGTSYDLHLVCNKEGVRIKESKFPKEHAKDSAGKSYIDLDGSTTPNGSFIPLKLEGSADFEITEWWWTDEGHNQLGEKKQGNPPEPGWK